MQIVVTATLGRDSSNATADREVRDGDRMWDITDHLGAALAVLTLGGAPEVVDPTPPGTALRTPARRRRGRNTESVVRTRRRSRLLGLSSRTSMEEDAVTRRRRQA